MKAQGGVELQLYSFFNLGYREGWMVNATPRLLYVQGRDPVHIVQEAGWTPGPSVWTGAENLAPTGIRYSDHPACSESLYQLIYLATDLSRPTEAIQRGKTRERHSWRTEGTRIQRNIPIKEEWNATGKFVGPL
jgi:hypothetical protein